MTVNIGFPVVRTDGRRSVGVRSRDYQFSGMGRFTKLWGFARTWSSAIIPNNRSLLSHSKLILMKRSPKQMQLSPVVGRLLIDFRFADFRMIRISAFPVFRISGFPRFRFSSQPAFDLAKPVE